MPKLNGRLPQYRLHRRSGQAIVTLNNKDHYLGQHGSEASRHKYDRLIAEWLAHGRNLPQCTDGPQVDGQELVSVNKVILCFWEYAQTYYRKADGTLTSEVDNLRQVIRLLRRFYGPTPAADFGPRAAKALREQMIALGWCRKSINKQLSRIKLIFRWAVENEMVPPSVYQALLAVRGLSRGRSNARESAPVKPVPDDLIAAVKPFVSRQVWALIQLQQLTGARAGELVRLRGVDLKTADKIWTVEPEDHKTAYLGHSKRIYFGPQAKEILQQFLQARPLDAFLFSPAEAEEERRAKLHAARRTPPTYGNRPGTNRRSNPKRSPGDKYTVCSYRRAIEHACDQAFPPPSHLSRWKVESPTESRFESAKEWKARLGPKAWQELKSWRQTHRWHPHQLRHNAATQLRKEYGIEVARIILGHRSAAVTEIYAELDDEKAKKIMRRIG